MGSLALNRDSLKRKEDHRRPHILIVEDSELDRGLLGDVLEDLGIVTFAGTGQEALELLDERDFELILLDIMLPDMDGFDLCKTLRESEYDDHLPIIFLTSLDDAGSEEQGLVIGASDYITKPFAPMVVKARVMNQINLYRTTREVKKANEKLALLAATDELTGVFNRRQFTNLAAEMYGRSIEEGQQSCFLMMDLDHFKPINDTYGHDAGDDVLVGVTKLWSEILRPNDILGRLGGEEFAVFLPDTSSEHAALIADRLCRKTNQAVILTNSHSLSVTVSIGIAMSGDDCESYEQLVKNADVSVYEAKNTGRNKIVIFKGDKICASPSGHS